MRDMFDDFLKELARRQRAEERAARGLPPDPEEGAVEGGAREVGPGLPEAAAGGEAGGEAEGEGEEPAAEEEGAAEEPAGAAEDETPGPAEPGGPEPAKRRGGPQPLFGRGGPPRQPSGERSSQGPRSPRRIGAQVLVIVVVVILAAIVLLLGTGVDLVTDATWFASVGYDGVFWTRVGYQVVLFLVGVGVVLAVLVFNLWLAGRLAPPPGEGTSGRFRAWVERLGEAAWTGDLGQRRDPFGVRRGPGGPGGGPGRPRIPGLALDTPELPDLTPLATIGIAVVAVLAALAVGGTLAGSWETIALWQHRVPFSEAGAAAITDPVFGRDVTYYLFELPFLRLVQSTAGGVLLASLLVAGGRYLAAAARGASSIPTPVRVHLAVLGGLYLATVAAGYQLDKLELVYSTRGFVVGVGYTDQAAQFFALDALTIVAGLVGALLIGGAFTRWLWPLGAGIVVWIGLSLLLGGIYPEVIQRFTVDPNQFAQERPYITNNIRMTRLAFGVEGWQDQSYSGDQPLTKEVIADDAATFQNARLWDYRPLQQTLDQLQTVRQYYDFVDVDTDRYQIGEVTRQVMLSARELAPERNSQAGTWVNQRITFTHGFGLAMVPVNEVDDQGLPRLIIKNLPPVASSGAPPVTEPRIYFGERDNDWVITGAKQAEFDYPIGTQEGAAPTDEPGQQTENRWAGTTGIRIDNLLTRLLFAAKLRDLNLLISDQVTADSQLLMHRSIKDRLQLLAPFLAYDKDPYLVVTGQGRLVYVQDAYTLSDRFPNAQWFDTSQLGEGSGLAGRSFNYMRNSVKVVMDAYDGRMTFYIADPTDPIVRAWAGVFPTLFHSFDEMPADLRAHLRVPEELFNVQTRVFARYHVTGEQSFFYGDDLWTVPQNPVSSETGQLPLEAYYVYMRMPGEDAPEFLLLQPMVPKDRPNMIAWVAARNDAPAYGDVRVFRFPRDTSIFGPTQIEARIDQEPAISSQLTLWSQAGSKVVRGNLIVIPVQDSIIYLEPIYLQSTGTSIPEFTKVVVASPTTVVWGDTLQEALDLLLAEGPQPSPTPGPSPTPSPTPGPTATPGPTPGPGESLPPGVDALVQYANDHFEAAQAALRAGDFAGYGAEIEKVRQALGQLEVLVGPSLAP